MSFVDIWFQSGARYMMAFHHMPTFLRSAIARDPFCHGGIITPEDVLRIEAKFPTLFDKPAPPTSPKHKDAEPETKNYIDDRPVDDKPVKEERKVTAASTGRNPNRGVSSAIKSTHTSAVNNTTKQRTGLGTTARLQSCLQTPLPGTPPRKQSQFHKACTEKVEEKSGQFKKPVDFTAVKGMVGKGKLAGSGRSKLIRPAQSFSLEDLRATLRQVMEEEALEENKWLRDARSQRSPYTEDLVKKFLGWKLMQSSQQRKMMKMQESRGGMKMKGQGDVASKPKTLRGTKSAYYEVSLASQGEKQRRVAEWSPGKGGKEKFVPRVRSAPGFIRVIPELPPTPNYQKKRMMLSMASKSKIMGKQADEGGQAAGDAQGRKKQIRWEDYEYYEDDTEHDGNNEETGKARKQISEESIQNATLVASEAHISRRSARVSGRGTQIHLRSNKKPEPEQTSTQQPYGENEAYRVKSSYKDILDARAEKTRYEIKGFLRKQEVPHNFHRRQVEREQRERKAAQWHREYSTNPDSSSDPSEQFARRINELGQRSKQETTEFLRKMAEELVYTEVLHQINELKHQQEETARQEQRRELFRPTPSTSPSPRQKGNKGLEAITLPEFVATTASEQGESEKDDKKKKENASSNSEIVLKTPELTPPSQNNKLKINRRTVEVENKEKRTQRDPVPGKNVDVISLHTPDLSPSPRRLIAAIKERKELERKLMESPPEQHQHLDTDCSEMSDFVFSEPSKKEDQRKKMIPPVQEESIQLETPQLSDSGQEQLEDEQDKSPAQPVDERPEKDGSTLSEVPSTFLETPSNMTNSKHGGKPEGREQDVLQESQKSSAKYSDDFTPEKEGSSKKVSSLPRAGAESAPKTLSEIFNDEDFKSELDPNENLNTSGETVIDLLSDGEFVGASYRSPGELSWRQQSRPQRQTSLPSNQSTVPTSVEQPLSLAVSTGEDEVNESISVLSLGAQIVPENGQSVNNLSFGEYLRV